MMLCREKSYKKVVELLKKPGMLAELHFVVSSASLFQTFTKKFQSEAPLIHILYSELTSVTQTIAGRVCKGAALSQTKSYSYAWEETKIFDAENLLPLSDIVLPQQVKSELSHLDSEKDRLMFLKNVQKHYISGAEHVIAKALTCAGSLKRALGCLSPEKRRLDKSCRNILRIARALPFEVPDDTLLDEWKCLHLEEDPDLEVASFRIDKYWAHFLSLRRADGSPKFPLVSKVVKAALCLSHGNADIERRFSVSSRTLTAEKAQMSARTLNSILIVKDELKLYNYKPHLVPITQKLISLGQAAHKHYQAFIEQERQAKEKEAKLREEEKKMREKEEERLKEANKKRKDIKEIESALSERKRKYNDTKGNADTLLEEATGRLKKALGKGDLKEAQLAQGMLEGVLSLKEDEEKERKAIDSLQKTVDKRKNTLITAFFQHDTKKPKTK